MNISEAITCMGKKGKVTRERWNGKGIYLEMRLPDENSKMTQSYIYINTSNLETDNTSVIKGLASWAFSQTDLLANDWVEV